MHNTQSQTYTINNASGASAESKKLRDVSKGGWDGRDLHENVHMTFLVDKIDMWRFHEDSI